MRHRAGSAPHPPRYLHAVGVAFGHLISEEQEPPPRYPYPGTLRPPSGILWTSVTSNWAPPSRPLTLARQSTNSSPSTCATPTPTLTTSTSWSSSRWKEEDAGRVGERELPAWGVLPCVCLWCVARPELEDSVSAANAPLLSRRRTPFSGLARLRPSAMWATACFCGTAQGSLIGQASSRRCEGSNGAQGEKGGGAESRACGQRHSRGEAAVRVAAWRHHLCYRLTPTPLCPGLADRSTRGSRDWLHVRQGETPVLK